MTHEQLGVIHRDIMPVNIGGSDPGRARPIVLVPLTTDAASGPFIQTYVCRSTR